MDRDIRQRIVDVMRPEGHRHLEMTDAIRCKSCGVKMARARGEMSRLQNEYPEKFVRAKPEERFHRETENLGDMLTERIKSDALYKNHLKLLAYGTPEEKLREMKRMDSGYYTRHVGDKTKILI